MKKLLIATRNKGKIREFSEFLSDLPIKLVALPELKIGDNIDEDKKTYRANSQKKAIYFAKRTRLPTIADDGGIEIEALGGAPGLKSRRWRGEKSWERNILEHMKKLAKELPDHKRTAYFKTVVSFALPNGKVWSARGTVQGTIVKKPFIRLSRGYPYRSFFYLPHLKKYYHEKDLTLDETKRYNHRYKAVLKLKPKIIDALNRYYSKKQG